MFIWRDLYCTAGCFAVFHSFDGARPMQWQLIDMNEHTDTPLCRAFAVLSISPSANWILYSLSNRLRELDLNLSVIIWFPIHFHYSAACENVYWQAIPQKRMFASMCEINSSQQPRMSVDLVNFYATNNWPSL